MWQRTGVFFFSLTLLILPQTDRLALFSLLCSFLFLKGRLLFSSLRIITIHKTLGMCVCVSHSMPRRSNYCVRHEVYSLSSCMTQLQACCVTGWYANSFFTTGLLLFPYCKCTNTSLAPHYDCKDMMNEVLHSDQISMCTIIDHHCIDGSCMAIVACCYQFIRKLLVRG